MGRVKVDLVKRIAKRLATEYPGRFSEDFYANKRVLQEMVEISSKKLRNLVAGYLVRILAVEKARGLSSREEPQAN